MNVNLVEYVWVFCLSHSLALAHITPLHRGLTGTSTTNTVHKTQHLAIARVKTWKAWMETGRRCYYRERREGGKEGSKLKEGLANGSVSLRAYVQLNYHVHIHTHSTRTYVRRSSS